jgi:PAS domain S-box-containing protein
MLARDGREVWFHDRAVRLGDADGHPLFIQGVMTNITERKSAEATLTAERNLLQALMDNIPDTIYFKDRESRFTRVNRAQAHLLGLSAPEAAIGKTDLDFQDTKLARAFYEEEQALMRNREPLIDRVEFNPRPDGSPRWLTATKVPLRDSAGQIVGLVGISRDITQHKLAEEREQRRRAMLEKVVELGKAVTEITDLEQCLRAIHRSVQKGLGFDRVGLFQYDAVNRQVRGALGTSESGEIEDTRWFTQSITAYDAWERALSNPRGLSVLDDYHTFHEVAPEGEMKNVRQHVTLAAWAGEQPVALITADNAITQRPFSDEQVEALQLFAGYAGLAIKNAHWNDELEQRVAERTAELETANRELESLSYTIAHDMRSPARAMVGYSQIVAEDHASQMDEAGRARLAQIHTEAKRMGQLVDDFLIFLRLGQRTLHKRTFDMRAAVERAWERLEAQRAGRALTIDIAALPEASADAELIEQVWMQFISNAVKFTRPRVLARIEIGSDEQDGVHRYFIRDNGIGFDMRYVDKLFSVFQRLNRQEEFEGTGVGLAIAQRIIHKHGGHIWAEAEVDKGATFYFTLG